MWRNAPELLVRFVEIKRQRGAAVPQWMATLADDVSKGNENVAEGNTR